MSKDQNRRESRNPNVIDAYDWAAPEDAVMVIRAWHEDGSDDSETWNWRGQISHKTTTMRFIGLGMLFEATNSILAAVASSQKPEDPDG